ncbi:NAD(+) synthase [Streptomyces sp. NBC_01565]|uniref:NAD(+) synthase n=1 Tax=unclassified Streptomyces TaxID=2593676 RepID=UPI00225AD857|nr:NAD(+) synthase [Streptomyces sp. NBC_01565]MCX4546305.1 NAD(+) synthase [Streptomyces sp. NBC_01565]
MRHASPPPPAALHPALFGCLSEIRSVRAFDAADYVREKCRVLNGYLRQNNLDSVVVGVSGGVDSAVVLALAETARKAPDSPLVNVVPVMAPINDTSAATGQSEGVNRSREVCDSLNLTPILVDLTAAHSALKSAVDADLPRAGANWASGQLASYIRTPAFYYAASTLTERGHAAIVLGTTNRDEGAYLGFFGKASDAMVDVQLISDLHKSEVYAVARQLQLPRSVIDAVPTGDMYDGRTDEDVFGTSYDFVELYLNWLALPSDKTESQKASWPESAHLEFAELATRLESLHGFNAHKYVASSPAIHLNVLPSAVPGGWSHGHGQGYGHGHIWAED